MADWCLDIYKIYQFNVHQSALAQTQSTIDEFKLTTTTAKNLQTIFDFKCSRF